MSKDNLLRITQINAAFLDKEIYKAFSQLIHESLKYFPPELIVPFEQEINLILRLLILNYSVVKNGSTFGQQMLCIKYERMSYIKKIVYVVSHCYEYFKHKTEQWHPGSKINDYLFRLDALIKLLNILNLTLFLRTSSKPLLIERFLGLNQVYARENVQRHFDSKYLARELLWNGLIELFVYVLPLVNYQKVRRLIYTMNPFLTKCSTDGTNVREFTTDTKCPHCGKTPIHPHHMGCAHVFCYVCLKGNQEADAKYECPVCSYCSSEKLCQRVTV